jgi:hypothetical protein
MDDSGLQIAVSDFLNRGIGPIMIGFHIPDRVFQVVAK